MKKEEYGGSTMEMMVDFNKRELLRIMTNAIHGYKIQVDINNKKYDLSHYLSDLDEGRIIFDCPELEEKLREKEKEEEKHTPQKQITREDITFHSYDGEYPNLCEGTLKLQVEDEIREYDHLLMSRGYFTPEGELVRMPWDIDKEELEKDIRVHADYIRDLVNKNLDWGCCGGCR